MNDEHDEHDGLLDKDPALDFILYQELEKDGGQKKSNVGCFSVVLLLGAFPVSFLVFLIARVFC